MNSPVLNLPVLTYIRVTHEISHPVRRKEFMKREIVSIAAICLLALPAWAAPLERGAKFTRDWSYARAQTLANEASSVIRASGYRCDSVTSIHRWIYSVGFDIVCNDYRYKYELEDRGGRWTAKLK